MDIARGALAEVVTASGAIARIRATSTPEPGRYFPIVWACTVGEYAEDEIRPGRQLGFPWPRDAILRVLDVAEEREPA